ncbi:MAG: glycosyltransferase [Shewanella sp.]|nr:glycosyltransferase [Shewanella sp.]
MEAARKIDTTLLLLGHHVELVCLDDPRADFISQYPVKVHPLGPSKGTYQYNQALTPWLNQNAGNFDAVVIDGLWQYHSFGAWRALAKKEIPYFIFTHGMLDPWFKKNYPLKHLKKWLYWTWGEYRVLRDAKAVLFTCEEEKFLARQSFWLYKANEVVTAFGTADAPKNGDQLADNFIRLYPELKNKRLALYLSRIHEKKGCDLLIEAFAKVASQDPALQLVMAGPDQTGWSSTLKSLAARHGISDRISWLGMLSGDVKWGAFYAAEVFCLPSHQENFGIVVAEALACGKPVIISNKVNIWREIQINDAGFVDEDTVQGTVNSLQHWLDLKPDAYAQMAGRAKKCFAEQFHIQRAAERLIEIIEERRA